MARISIQQLIPDVSVQYGAPMGRSNTGTAPTDGTRIFDRAVPMIDGAYDRGGAYWGIGPQLRVKYTRDLSYIEFYRLGNKVS